jgi:hypothetical protein
MSGAKTTVDIIQRMQKLYSSKWVCVMTDQHIQTVHVSQEKSHMVGQGLALQLEKNGRLPAPFCAQMDARLGANNMAYVLPTCTQGASGS